METEPKKLDKSRAWGFTTSNLAVFPGLGSLMAGRRSAYPQLFLATIGAGLSLLWLGGMMRAIISTHSIPLEFNGLLKMGLVGVGCYGTAWLWALATSLSIVREAKRNEKKP